MKITGIKSEWIRVPYSRPFVPTWFPGQTDDAQSILLVRVQTDEGIEGHASTECPFGLAPAYMEMIKGQIEPSFINEDPFMVERLVAKLRATSRLSCRPWLVENALWDIIGKASNQPVYRIWGAYTNKIMAYAAWGELRSNEQRAQDALRLVDEGFKAVKIRFSSETMKEDIALVECLRAAVGDKLMIGVDANQGTVKDRGVGTNTPRWSYERAYATAKELYQLGVAWLEEPLYHYDYYGLTKLCNSVEIPIAGGEIMRDASELAMLIDRDCYDIIMANQTLATSMTDIRKIAGMADFRGKTFNLHGWVPGTGVAACVHLACSLPNSNILEYPYDYPILMPDEFQGIVKEPLLVKDGYLTAPEKPGWGVELDEEKIKKHTVLSK